MILRIFCISLLVFHKFLEPKVCYIEIWFHYSLSQCPWWIYPSQSVINIKNLLYSECAIITDFKESIYIVAARMDDFVIGIVEHLLYKSWDSFL